MSFIDPNLMSAFQTVQTSKPLESNDYLPRLPDGTHEVMLTHFGGRPTQQQGICLEGEFIIEKSTTPEVKPGDRRGWPWFPQMQGYAGGYERERYKTFTDSCDGTVGNPAREAPMVGTDLALGKFNGIRLRVEVQPRFDKKTGQRAHDKNGRPLSNAFFFVIAPQTWQEIQARQPSLPTPFASAARGPGGTGGQQFQQAPHPSQMQAAYPAQQATYPAQAQPQAAPQGYPQQPQYPAQPQAAPQGYPAQPQQPAYPAQAQPQPQPQAAPQGYPQQPAYPAQQPVYPQMPGMPVQGQPQPQYPTQPGAPAPGQGNPMNVLQGLRQG